MKIEIKIEVEDVTELKMHLQLIRSKILAALKQEGEDEEQHSFDSQSGNHQIIIKK